MRAAPRPSPPDRGVLRVARRISSRSSGGAARTWAGAALAAAVFGGSLLSGAPSRAQWSSEIPMCLLEDGAPLDTSSSGVGALLAAPATTPSQHSPLPDATDASSWTALRAGAPRDPIAAARALAALAVDHPGLADRFELRRLEVILDHWTRAPATAQPPDPESCELAAALASPSSGVAARARVLRARCLFVIDDPRAGENLAELLRRYPELPDEVSLRLDQARSLERRERWAEALTGYRELDLRYPGTLEGQLAHERLVALAAAGRPFAPYTDRELVDRATRLVRSGPPELARIELAGLRAASLPGPLAAEVATLAARVARVEGRFDESDALTAEARALDPRLAAAPAEAVARPAEDTVGRALRAAGLGVLLQPDVPAAQRARALRRASSARLLEATRVTARAALADATTALVEEAARRPTLACGARFEIGVLASGTARDEAVEALLARCVEDAAYGVRARYLRARSLERLGRTDEASALYREITALDRSDTGFYALWSRARLGETAAPSTGPASAEAPVAPAPPPPTDEDLAASLGALVEGHGEAFPWLARARDLLRLGDRDGAREELHELYVAWLDARGRGPIRAGVEAVYRGATRPRTVVPAPLRRARRELAGQDAATLAGVAEDIGDVGLAIRFGGRTRASDRPRAYEELVVAAAGRHGLDPNLLLAVMRVESVYDPEIVSYAGAVGLLQIMPRTGRLIAHRLGLEGFRTDDLLDPRTNIELAAWYLSSLLERFEGRLPLAIAAYNGGPHNVRRWMEEHAPTIPLDAFLERIPFDQTFRYVRRVLSHYVAYRAQQGLPLPELDTTLPPRATDGVAF